MYTCKIWRSDSSQYMSQEINKQFEDIFEQYSDTIYRLCLFKTSNEDVAQDLTQDVFTKFYEYLHKNGLPDKPKSFLYQMTRNRIIDHYRKHTTDSLEQVEESGIQFSGNEGVPEAEILTDYRIAIEAINRLDRKYRDVMYMRLVEEYGVSEIAEHLEITPSNVSVRLNRGKKQLGKLLQI